jgi:hypothetical protein
VAATGAVSSGKTVAKETAFEIFTKGCLYMDWDTVGKVFPLFKVGQISFQILSRDLVQ